MFLEEEEVYKKPFHETMRTEKRNVEGKNSAKKIEFEKEILTVKTVALQGDYDDKMLLEVDDTHLETFFL